jgi:hypothetical protein
MQAMTTEPKSLAEIHAAAKERQARMWGYPSSAVPVERVRPAPKPPRPRVASATKPEPDPDAVRYPLPIQPPRLGRMSSREFQRALGAWAAERWGVDVEEIFSRSRMPSPIRARQDVMFEMCKQTILSYSQIGRMLGYDHTTIRHAVMQLDAVQGTKIAAMRVPTKRAAVK